MPVVVAEACAVVEQRVQKVNCEFLSFFFFEANCQSPFVGKYGSTIEHCVFQLCGSFVRLLLIRKRITNEEIRLEHLKSALYECGRVRASAQASNHARFCQVSDAMIEIGFLRQEYGAICDGILWKRHTTTGDL